MPETYTGEIDSHPYGIALTDETIYVADAGANSVVSVDAGSGKTETVAVLPPRPYKITAEAAASNGLPDCVVGTTYDFESVPTDVAVGADGWLYVTSLPGGPEDPALGARGAIFKVSPDGDEVKLVAEDIMSPTGLALADNGDMYVASLFGDGVLKVDPDSGEQTVVLAAGFTADVDLRGRHPLRHGQRTARARGPARWPGHVCGAERPLTHLPSCQTECHTEMAGPLRGRPFPFGKIMRLLLDYLLLSSSTSSSSMRSRSSSSKSSSSSSTSWGVSLL